ncbi:aggregation factor core [Yoonia sp. 208BN28-4]|uniref:aggregation factor core n=1 Tax=Yoonia sp. 208BN28-4 TaxID=3126505 RepID=UPI0030952174
MRLIAIAACLTAALPAHADFALTFRDGAPKDRFELTGMDTCGIGAAQLTIDLAGSAGGLIFDVTAEGAGVEVFQPLEVVAGRDRLSALPTVSDGDTMIQFDLSALAGDPVLAFTVDLDDTGATRQITVSGAEIAGASATISWPTGQMTGRFDASATAILAQTACTS